MPTDCILCGGTGKRYENVRRNCDRCGGSGIDHEAKRKSEEAQRQRAKTNNKATAAAGAGGKIKGRDFLIGAVTGFFVFGCLVKSMGWEQGPAVVGSVVAGIAAIIFGRSPSSPLSLASSPVSFCATIQSSRFPMIYLIVGHRHFERAQQAGNATRVRAAGTSPDGKKAHRADQRRFRLRCRDFGWRTPRSQASHDRWHAHLREGHDTDDHSTRRQQWSAPAEHAKHFHPSFRVLHGAGILPEVVVENSEGASSRYVQLERALGLLRPPL